MQQVQIIILSLSVYMHISIYLYLSIYLSISLLSSLLSISPGYACMSRATASKLGSDLQRETHRERETHLSDIYRSDIYIGHIYVCIDLNISSFAKASPVHASVQGQLAVAVVLLQ